MKNLSGSTGSCSTFPVRGGATMPVRAFFKEKDGVLNPPPTSSVNPWNRNAEPADYSILKTAIGPDLRPYRSASWIEFRLRLTITPPRTGTGIKA